MSGTGAREKFSPGKAALSRADLLRCIAAIGPARLEQIAPLTGFQRSEKSRPEPKETRELSSQAERPQSSAKTPERAPIRPSAMPKAFFYRVVEYNRRPVHESDGEVPDWFKNAVPLLPRQAQEIRLPAPPPLTVWSRLWPLLHSVLGANWQTRRIDVERVVHDAALGRVLRRLPFQRKEGWSPLCQVIVDFDRRLIPFWDDFNRLCRALDKLRGRSGMEILAFENGPDGACRPWRDPRVEPKLYAAPEPGTPVLILSDLGCLQDGDGIHNAWLRIGRRLQKSGSVAVALNPCPKRQWRAELSRFFVRVGWDRGQRIPRKIQKRRMIESAAEPMSPDRSAERLLALLSCAIRVEPALLRAVRCLVGPDSGDAGSEAGFWNHTDILPNPTACSYANRDAITRYRNDFKRQPRALQEQVIRTIAEYHAWLPEEIRNEEQRIAKSLLGDTAPDGPEERLMQSFLKSYFEDPDNADYRSWVLRMAERQHGGIWQDSKVLTAIWVKAHERALKSGEPLEIPPGLDISNASWVLSGPRKSQKFRIDQAGQTLTLRAESGSGAPASGSPVGSMESSTGMLQVVIDSPDFGSRSYAFDCSKGDNRIPLPESGRVRLATDRDEIVLETLLKPGWATAMGRGREGLFAALSEEHGNRRLLWLNPGIYPVAGRENILDFFLNQGFFMDEEEARPLLEHGFQKPEWADEFGVDEYGIYAVFKFNDASQTLRWIPPGSFGMGSPEDEPERADDETLHEVILTRGFWLADAACTEALWQAVMGENPIQFKRRDRPVERGSWEDAQAFITKINTETPSLDLRLPTDAEWEYACRAGTTTPFWFGDNITPENVNYDGNYPYEGGKKGQFRGETVAVKSLPCNSWGLYEMHGNVWEWCQDWYGKYESGPVVDSKGPTTGGTRVLRGGCWISNARFARSAYRSRDEPDYRRNLTGFRLARGQSGGPGGVQKPEKSSPGQAQRSAAGQGLRHKNKKLPKR